jgi:hypothetical protein
MPKREVFFSFSNDPSDVFSFPLSQASSKPSEKSSKTINHGLNTIPQEDELVLMPPIASSTPKALGHQIDHKPSEEFNKSLNEFKEEFSLPPPQSSSTPTSSPLLEEISNPNDSTANNNTSKNVPQANSTLLSKSLTVNSRNSSPGIRSKRFQPDKRTKKNVSYLDLESINKKESQPVKPPFQSDQERLIFQLDNLLKLRKLSLERTAAINLLKKQALELVTSSSTKTENLTKVEEVDQMNLEEDKIVENQEDEKHEIDIKDTNCIIATLNKHENTLEEEISLDQPKLKESNLGTSDIIEQSNQKSFELDMPSLGTEQQIEHKNDIIEQSNQKSLELDMPSLGAEQKIEHKKNLNDTQVSEEKLFEEDFYLDLTKEKSKLDEEEKFVENKVNDNPENGSKTIDIFIENKNTAEDLVNSNNKQLSTLNQTTPRSGIYFDDDPSDEWRPLSKETTIPFPSTPKTPAKIKPKMPYLPPIPKFQPKNIVFQGSPRIQHPVSMAPLDLAMHAPKPPVIQMAPMRPQIVAPIVPIRPLVSVSAEISRWNNINFQKLQSLELNKLRMFEFRRGRPLLNKPTRVKRFDIPKPNFKPSNYNVSNNNKKKPQFIQNMNKKINSRIKSPKRMRDSRNISDISEAEINDESFEIEREEKTIYEKTVFEKRHEKIANTQYMRKKKNLDKDYTHAKNVFGDLYPITSASLQFDSESNLTEEIQWIKKFTHELNENLILRDPKLNFFINQLDTNIHDSYETEKDESEFSENSSRSSPSPDYSKNSQNKKISPADKLDHSIKSILKKLSDLNSDSEDDEISKNNSVRNEMDASLLFKKTENMKLDTEHKNKSSINIENSAQNQTKLNIDQLLLSVAQETTRKKNLELEMLKKKVNTDNTEITRLIDLLAITFNSFKLVNDKNVLINKLKKSMINT